MMLFKIGVDKSPVVRAKAEVDPTAQYATASIVVRPTIKGIAQHMAKSARSVVTITTSKLYVRVVQKAMKAKEIIVNRDLKRAKEKSSMRFVKTMKGVMDDLTEQVQSLFYNDVRFNAVNTRMHITVECETPDGKCSENTFKIDTGVDDNLIPIPMFTKYLAM